MPRLNDGGTIGDTPSLANTAGWSDRATWLVLALVPAAVLITARSLSPDPSGVGTHTQLGLPPCGFLLWTHLPCPGCGLTTSFAHMARFDLGGAWSSNFLGIPLFLVTVGSIFLAVAGLLGGWTVLGTLIRIRAHAVLLGLSLLALVSWGVRVAAAVGT